MTLSIQLLFLFTMFTAIWGSHEFVRSNFIFGAKLFIIGNFFNILLGFYIGNLYFSIAQFGLLYFTTPMLNIKLEKTFFIQLIATSMTLCLLFWGKINISSFEFNPSSLVDMIATITAWIGAWSMAQGKFKTMAVAWIVADIGFLWIAYENQILGLGIMASVFIINGARRLLK